jgi:protein-S-isoprenylcysteine O-methyltransferase Ste14
MKSAVGVQHPGKIVLEDPHPKKSALERHRGWINLAMWSFIFATVIFNGFSREKPLIYGLEEITGFILIAVATMGTLWCGSYLFGRKSKQLCQDGPYSVCRNPLYLFSGLGGLGVVIITNRLILVIVYLVVFCVNYFLVVRFEEKRLLFLFGTEYESYTARVPRLIPRFRNYQTSDKLQVDPRRQLLGIVKSMRFFGMAFAINLIEVLKEFYL